MAEMKKKGRCWKGYKPKPGAKPYSKGSCIPEAKKMGKVNPWAVCTASTGREDKAKYERCVKAVKEVKVTPTPAERKKNPQARANDKGNRAATLRGKLSARIQSREDYPEDSPLHTGGSSEVDKGRMSKLKKIKEGAKEDYKKDDSDKRAQDTFDRAEPFERRPYSSNSASNSDTHDFARDRGESSRQPKKIRGRKETEREQNARRKYLKSTIKIRRRDR